MPKKNNRKTARDIAPTLVKAKQTGPGQWTACCPAHEDSTPSLSITDADDRTLIHCFAGCTFTEVIAAMGVKPAELFDGNGSAKTRTNGKAGPPTTDTAISTEPFNGRNGSTLSEALHRLSVQWRYDTRGQAPQIRRPLAGNQWENLSDTAEEDLRNELAQTFWYRRADDKLAPFYFGREVWKTSFFALLHHAQVDPFAEWLAVEVGAHSWDRKERLNGWLAEVFDIDPCCPASLVAWAGRHLLIGAIRRCLKPGEKLDEVPVLVGGQGIGKSTAPKLLLPADYRDLWFKDELDLSGSNKERVEATLGAVIVEVSEMAGSTRAEIESLKAYVTRQHDNVRLAYRHNPDHLPRKFVLIGTTNSKTSLPNDPSGNRRFVPIDLNGGGADRVRNYLESHRMDLWAEAIDCVHHDAEARLPNHMKAEAKRAAEAHRRSDDILEDKLELFVTGRDDGFTLSEAALACGFGESPHRAEEMRLGGALQAMGFARRRARGADGLRWRWFSP